jgi:large subunit ribosomal protein L5
MAKPTDKDDAKPAKPAKADKGAEAKAPKGEAKAAKGEKGEAKAKGEAAPKVKVPKEPAPPARLHVHYRQKIVPELKETLKLENVMEVPRISKITVNMGVGEAVADKKIMDNAVADLTKITGQKPQVTKARKSVATFKVRDGLAIGAKVTLRGGRMYEFLDRLVSIAMPRIRDFRGLSARSFDGRGNYNFGVKEQIIFPEIAYDQIDAIRGMDITITTTARDDKSGRALLEAFNFPFRK